MVGVTGLEPATSRPPAVRASQLRHTPFIFISIKNPVSVWIPAGNQVGALIQSPRAYLILSSRQRLHSEINA